MKLTISKDKLVTALERCRRVADSKSAMPILGHVLIEPQRPNSVRFAATDLYLSTSTDCEARCEGTAESHALPARDLLDRVKMMPAGELVIAVDGECSATISSVGNKRRFKLHALPGSEFPEIPKAGEQTHSLSAEALRRLLAETAFAISTDETRLHLNSLLVDFAADGLTCVATDGHRLARSTLAGASWKPLSMLVPLKGVLELRRMADAVDGDINLSASGPSLFASSGDHTVGVKLVDAQFPPWRQVVPASSTATVRVPREAFADSVRAVSLSASERTGGVRLGFADGKIHIYAESAEAGEGSDEVQAECSHHQTIGVNARYVLDVCAALECEELLIGISGELDPITIAPDAPAAGWEFGGVIMPMRT